MYHKPLIAFALAVLGTALIHSVAAAAGPTIATAPAAMTADVGQSFTLEYTVDDVPADPGAAGYAVAVAFDPAVLEMVSIVDTGFITSGDNIVVCGPPQIDNAAGSAVAFCAPIPLFGAPGLAAETPTAIARSTFRAKAPGASSISLAGSYLLSPANVQIPAQLAGGSVTVATASTATVTATPVVSATPTTAPATSTPDPSPAPVLTRAVSTNTPGETFTSVEAPVTGSDGPAGGTDAQAWIVGFGVAGLALTTLAAISIYLRRRKKASGSP